MAAEAVVHGGSQTFHIVGTVRGLVAEEARVHEAFGRVHPRAVALGLGEEDLAGLRSLVGGAAYEHDFSEADEVYAHFLEHYGPVELPPRDLVAAVRRADELGIPVVPLDLAEVAYVEAFTEAVSGWQLLRYNRLVRRLAKRVPEFETPLEFHRWWDAQVCRLGGFARLEARREAHMAKSLQSAAFPPGPVLVLVEAARLEGLLSHLQPHMRIAGQS